MEEKGVNLDKVADLGAEWRLIIEKLKAVKEAGFGEVIIKVAEGKIVYITHAIGEQVKTK